MNTLVASKAPLLRGSRRDSNPHAISTVRLIAYMLGTGIVCGVVWYVALAIGVEHVTVPPAHPHRAEHQIRRTA